MTRKVLLFNGCLCNFKFLPPYRLIGREVSHEELKDILLLTLVQAIASRPASCVKAYLIGGLAWFAIPFTFATTLGLAAVALRNDPDMPLLTAADVSAGLPAPSAAAALLGEAGASAMLVLLFLAVTSATSAELIAVSSILTYDVYKVRC